MAKRTLKTGQLVLEHIKQLRTLDREFRKLEKETRKAIKANPDLEALKTQFEITRDAIEGPAFGFPPPRRKKRSPRRKKR